MFRRILEIGQTCVGCVWVNVCSLLWLSSHQNHISSNGPHLLLEQHNYGPAWFHTLLHLQMWHITDISQSSRSARVVHSQLRSLWHTAQIFKVRLLLIFTCTNYFIFVFRCPGNLRDDICNMSNFSHAYSWTLLMRETSFSSDANANVLFAPVGLWNTESK